ncbi:metallophosphoesterase 1-like isoform X3 [Mangifera indica]|uniref:metallophosphoesterase 1-like isoform X3 n=1 Tax=Mangifera indica TaxID=29780 RepID=UPI001CFBDF40|nr:metallophosphoesterase 1-like isoform X3 [Mangifera indica]
MEAIAWRSVLSLIVVSSLMVYEEWVSAPSCKIIPGPDPYEHESGRGTEELKVMLVGDLLLLGSEAGFVNRYFRDYYMAKFFRKSFDSLNPDMLLVLGDVSARGSESTRSNWLPVFNQFDRMLGPFLGLPFHVTLGDRDIGECSGLNPQSVNWIAGNLPGLDSAGCGAFEISNVSFVSVNAVALLCGNNKLRFSVEKVIERERIDLRMGEEGTAEAINYSGKFGKTYNDFARRENDTSSLSGPVLLLHFPLDRRDDGKCSHENSNTRESRGVLGPGPYDLLHTVPPNATKYIFQSIKPRIIFSAHTHEFCDHTHQDGTREVTVSAMTWKARDDPGFVVATFHGNRREPFMLDRIIEKQIQRLR